ncbi:M23 family metallopeptidase [Rhodococcus sp. IEGM 1351]|uniref:M23 family metallopeptidase n=1 Tax=Rhodococcus sp. IEGM 1351 TaxID=3047089 RepID=UPI0024B6D326|nr:M23 family metallopeptidase [Rhodococcus sp. IEGM 1351]MDI9934675.1 M23 family metallopeptidase [Rhodococcus sp. IEGM 1351]
MSRFVRPVDDAITQQWGANPDYYKQFGQNGHTGIDFKSAIGTPIRATGDGRVVFAGSGSIHGGFLSIAGNAMLIDHGDIYSAYSHLSKYEVGTGTTVKQGQIIGYTGNTGEVTGPHLHFEFWGKPTDWKNGWSGRVNPNDYLSQEGEEMKPTEQDVANIVGEVWGIPANANNIRDYTELDWKDFIYRLLGNSTPWMDRKNYFTNIESQNKSLLKQLDAALKKVPADTSDAEKLVQAMKDAMGIK